MTPVARASRRAVAAVLLGLLVAIAWVVGATAAAASGAVAPAGVGVWGSAGLPAADSMASFAGRYDVDRDGGVGITETISYRFDAAGGARHGIYRSITVRQGLDGRPDDYRYYAMTDVSVSSPTGANTDVQLVDAGAATTIKIGSAKEEVSGTQTYVVRYHLAHVLNAFPDSGVAELFLNVFTDDPVAKSQVDLQVSAPAPATQVRCGRGPDGRDCDVATAGDVTRFAVSSLASQEDLTIAAKYPLAAFASVVPDIRTGGSPLSEAQARAASYAALAVGLLLPLVAGIGMGALVATRGATSGTPVSPRGSRPGRRRRPTRRRRPAGGGRPRWPSSSTRPLGCSPGWWARSSTRRSTPSTSRRRSSTWRSAAGSPSRRSTGRA